MELRPARPMVDGLGRKEIKTERRARGFSPASSRSLGRHLDRVVAAHSFSAPMRQVVATSDGPPAKVRVKSQSASSGEALHWVRAIQDGSSRRGDGEGVG
jgi:hypothetical protein